MTDISELERKMLTCDHKCAEHESTQESIHEIKKALHISQKRRKQRRT